MNRTELSAVTWMRARLPPCVESAEGTRGDHAQRLHTAVAAGSRRPSAQPLGPRRRRRVCAATAAIEFGMGRLPLRTRWPHGDSGRQHLEQRAIAAVRGSLHLLAHDPRDALLRDPVAGRAPGASVRRRFIGALVLEGAWEILEELPIIINRYREATIALGYVGDSVFNSVSDILFAALGFLFALGGHGHGSPWRSLSRWKSARCCGCVITFHAEHRHAAPPARHDQGLADGRPTVAVGTTSPPAGGVSFSPREPVVAALAEALAR